METTKWLASARDIISDDLQDIHSYPDTCAKGLDVVKTLHELLLLSNDLKKQQMLLKFYLQLKTYTSDNIIKMDKPYSVETSSRHREALEAANAAFVVVSPPEQSVEAEPTILEVSDAFLEMSAFTRDHLVGRGWSELWSREVTAERWTSLVLCLHAGDSRLEIMLLRRQSLQ